MQTAVSAARQVHGAPWLLPFLVAGACLLSGFLSSSRAADPPSAAAILQDLRSFNEMGSVLHVAAHPDDENTTLITFLARGRGCRTAYLSLTRGDGGQNLLGPEFGETLGVLRTQELLAARRLDGGRQFFTRAIDFGFSKDYLKTLTIWDKEQVLGDVVRVIRSFRPDVIVTRFSTKPGGTHGHHTASAVLAVAAFKIAGDREAYPEQLGELTPWQPKRIVMNGGGGGKGGATLRLEVSGNDPVLGISFGEIAARSRAMHKTQGFGMFAGGGGKGGAKTESFQLLDGLPATKDLFEGVNTTWSRVKGGAEVGKLAEKAIAQFNLKDPSASVPALLELRKHLAALPTDPVVNEKREQLDRILAACLGLDVETVLPQAEVVPGETMKLRHSATVRSAVGVRWVAVRYPSLAKGQSTHVAMDLRPNQPATRETMPTLPADTPLSQPYWLRADHSEGLFKVADPTLIGRPENPPAVPVEYIFDVGGQTLVVADEPVQIVAGKDQLRRRMEVIPPVALGFASNVELFAPSAAKPVTVEITALRTDSAGTVSLDAPAGWKVAPATQPFRLAAVGEQARFTFTVTAPPQPATAGINARVQINGATFGHQRVEIRYKHLPPVLLQPNARFKAVALDLAVRGKQVGYLAGAGDSVAESLKQMGYTVTQLTGADLTPERLREFDAVVIGIRAFNTRTDLAARLPALFAFVEAGGNIIVQYNKPNGLQTTKLAPFDLRVGPDRVTDKNSKMTFLAPDHPALNAPNKITEADFEGWVQERGLYFASDWDKRFTPLVACNDPGDNPLKGGLLVAQHGRGYFVYTSFSWFRQLPDGVPGAYRIFANLVSLGKK
jgi:LmbE family N-acetylglucosaminyl deacetylase